MSSAVDLPVLPMDAVNVSLVARLPITLTPDRSLLHYYLLSCLALGPFFPFAAVPYYFRFRSLRYHVDEEGITMRWGVLFRREISLTYTRIQDIHLSSNFVERWLGLGRIQVQTASGSASAEMTIEGLEQYQAFRDFLYTRMRGASSPKAALGSEAGQISSAGDAGELAQALRAVAAEVRALRESLPTSGRPTGER